MTDVKLMVLYPQPTDVAQFDNDYRDHLGLFHRQHNAGQGRALRAKRSGGRES